MNWVCNACGMASGRRESVQRHIDNPRWHKGNATAIPFVDYLAGLKAGIYPPSIYNLFTSRDKVAHHSSSEAPLSGNFFDKIHEKVIEKTIENIAERMVNPASSVPQFPLMQNPAYSFRQQPFSFPGEDIFGIGGYICSSCLVIKPVIFSYSIGSHDRSHPSIIYPLNSCYGSSERMSNEEQEHYLNYNQTHGYPTALLTWI